MHRCIYAYILLLILSISNIFRCCSPGSNWFTKVDIISSLYTATPRKTIWLPPSVQPYLQKHFYKLLDFLQLTVFEERRSFLVLSTCVCSCASKYCEGCVEKQCSYITVYVCISVIVYFETMWEMLEAKGNSDLEIAYVRLCVCRNGLLSLVTDRLTSTSRTASARTMANEDKITNTSFCRTVADEQNSISFGKLSASIRNYSEVRCCTERTVPEWWRRRGRAGIRRFFWDVSWIGLRF